MSQGPTPKNNNAKDPHPALLAQPSQDYLGPNGSTHTFKNAQGLQIMSYYWPAEGTARGILTVCHGHGSYACFDYLKANGLGTGSHLYEGSWIAALNKAGFSVCGIDNQGSGRSEGLRCFADKFEHYIDDVLAHVRQSTTLGKAGFSAGLPHFICGMSMGGAVAIIASMRATELFAGVVCIAPMISLEKVSKQGLNPYLRPIGSIFSAIAPRAAVVVVNRNTMYPDLQASFDQDPGTYGGNTRARSGYEYLKATEWLCAHLQDISLPILIFHSEDDTQCDPEGSKKAIEAAKSGDKTLRLLKGFWHILMKEPGNEALRDELIAWLTQRTAAK